MSFPSTWEIIRQFHFFLLSGPIFITFGIGCLVKMYRNSNPHRQARKKASAPWPVLAVLAIFAIVIGSAHVLIYRQVANAFKFRFDPARVTSIEVSYRELMGTDRSEVPLRKSVVIDDPALIQEGLLKLATARSFQTNHEHYEGIAYRIDLRFKEPGWRHSRQWLELCDRTDRRADVNVVIPRFGWRRDNWNWGGQYTCPEFHEWFAENVMPLFQKSAPPSAEAPSSQNATDTEME